MDRAADASLAELRRRKAVTPENQATQTKTADADAGCSDHASGSEYFTGSEGEEDVDVEAEARLS